MPDAPEHYAHAGTQRNAPAGTPREPNAPQAPQIALPRGGGALRGIGEKFAANPVTGTGALSIPIATPPGRSGFGPQLALSYDSGAGNGPFGFGWGLALAAITRKTDKGLPQYADEAESDVFILSGAEDLVPVLNPDGSRFVDRLSAPGYSIHRYRPRIEGLFARIERWTRSDGDVHWRSLSRDNTLTIYGSDQGSRIFDPGPAAPGAPRIFSWLIAETRDDRGNAVRYSYKAEDGAALDLTQAHERNRGPRDDRRRTAQRYIKRIEYGNAITLLDADARRPDVLTPAQLQQARWMFEVVFDYGEHDLAAPTPAEAQVWPARPDRFASYRAGFEVRTCRRCERVLIFHHLPPLDPGQPGYDGLVRSTDLHYHAEQDPDTLDAPIYSFLQSVTQTVYERDGDGYRRRSLPPVAFSYSRPVLADTVEELDAASRANLPIGLDGASYRWVDLHGEGLPGVLTEQAGAWFYRRNLSPLGQGAALAPLELVARKPGPALADGAQLLDLAGDGLPDLVVFAGAAAGLYEHDAAEGWQPFRPFTERLTRDLRDPNARLIDLDGDGRADLLITEDDALVWHASLAEAGFGPAARLPQPRDDERGPRLVFADADQAIYLADMSGDGLTDLVRVRSGAICYWPNLGYGRFGAKITMDGAPHLDQPDQFDQRRVRLADIDGSGASDLIYLHRDGVRLYFNQCGSSWSPARTLAAAPRIDDPAAVSAVDLLGNGTACLVWSSPLPGDAARPLRYVRLMGAQKPHLLIKVVNNLGAETSIAYAPSTMFYLQDRQAGTPWIARLPFPVHCVERVTVHDRWRQTTFTTRYRYHHGCFDGEEREFRGFGCVEQIDVEDYGTFADVNSASPYITADRRLYQPPVKTVRWHHTGTAPDREQAMGPYAQAYFPAWFKAQQPGAQVLGAFREHTLAELELAAGELGADDWREALRASKGMLLRQEVYELDVEAIAAGRELPVRILTASQHGCRISQIQGRGPNRHGVYLAVEREAIHYHYELDLRAPTLAPDPRISHTLNLTIDDYGNIVQAVTVGYPRVQPPPPNDPPLDAAAAALIAAVQGELHLAYVETRHTDDVLDGAYRLRLPCEVRAYELGGVTPANAGDGRYLTLARLGAFQLSPRHQPDGAPVQPLAYHERLGHAAPQMRLVEQTRTLFCQPNLRDPRPLGELDPRGLPYETYTLALSADLLAALIGDALRPDVLGALADQATSGYLSGPALVARLGADTAGQYWRCSGVAGFSPDAAAHFFLPEHYRDPFGAITTVSYDRRDLFVETSTDAAGNTVAVERFDYRVLAPQAIRDPNGSRSAARFDLLGVPTATAISGGAGEGDTLPDPADPILHLDRAALERFFITDDYREGEARRLLGGAGTRHLYHFGETTVDGAVVWGRHPPCAASIAREQHGRADGPVQTSFAYTDGSGSPLLARVQAEPELPNGPPRWVASGMVIRNNKGSPVRQYEPFFSPPAVGHRFAEPQAIGVATTIFYDAVGRVIRTEAPDGSFSRVAFSPWQMATYDHNDTLADPGNAWLARMRASPLPAERRAAQLAAAHAGTPALTVLDSLGRAVVAIAHNRADGRDELHLTFTRLDAEGKPLWVRDARGNLVMQYIAPRKPARRADEPDPANPERVPPGAVPGYDLAGRLLLQHSMDSGTRRMLPDAAGQLLFSWDSRGFRTRTTYDRMRRPLGVFVRAEGAFTLPGAPRDADRPPDAEAMVERRVYGEGHPDATANLRGQLFRTYDSAGVATNRRYDFKGNLLVQSRRYARDYKGLPDWSALAGLDDPGQIAAAAEPLLESAPPLIARTDYDALNRPTRAVAPDGSAYLPAYNAANLLERVDVQLPGAAGATPFVRNIDYNARGQRERVVYGNGATTGYRYDPLTFRLTGLQSTRPAQPDATAALLFAGPTVVQDLRYTYDAVGNITQIVDGALRTTPQAGAACAYRYDALYRLVAAGGREHQGQTELAPGPGDGSQRDMPFVGGRIHPNDLQGLAGYVERYRYDAVGNLLQLEHHGGGDPDAPGPLRWRRRYQYALDSNRLLATSLPGEAELPAYAAAPGYGQPYRHDAHGNMVQMPHLPLMRWDHRDMLSAASRQVVNGGAGETTYYVYDGAGRRVRSVTETQAGAPKSERRYVGGYEIYRAYGGGAVSLERTTLHVMDDQQRIALVETAAAPAAPPRIRYQLGNHLGSASVELDEAGALIAYEEYHPYGSSAFQAGRSAAEVRGRRYRYTGKERDDETGLSYHGARSYAPWLGRWASADPIGIEAGLNRYGYVRCNPIRLIDPQGTEDKPAHTPDATSVLQIVGVVLEVEFYHHTRQTPKQFGRGMLDKFKSITVDPVLTIYGPGGMLDKAAQKAVDKMQGVKHPDEYYVTKEEHDKQLGAIIGVGSLLLPPLEMPGGAAAGPAMATPEGIVVQAPLQATKTEVSTAGPLAASGAALSKGGGTSPKKGPGEWLDDITAEQNMTKDQAKYQKQQTGAPAGKTYYVKGRSFDGFEPGKAGAKDTLVEAKHLANDGRFAKAYENMKKGNFSDLENLVDRAEKILDQAKEQVKAAEGTGARIEWRVSGERAQEALKVLFERDPVTKGKIDVVYRPFK